MSTVTPTSTTVYTASATSWGGRSGKVVTSDNKLQLDLSIPAEMGGDNGPGTNPEQLFASGWAACFHNALKGVARQQKLDVADSAVTLTVNLVGGMATGFDFEVTIEAQLPGIDPATAQAALAAAHEVCPYSRATRGNIAVNLVVVSDDE
ncbi:MULTISPECIES: organic hydroperoxide resistance protein [Cryobacterium]|uniref:Organic hydroperoxide resistance protein n=1 Tax=Cryobacterium breve TaxID=1259258 RepID=A0ABY2J294_9MICO|nr:MULTISPECIES: organic hydroperoxide resistance protein [Cryobacterium]TFC95955.1 organic hydroperoxide resistance protein [Cryobacterium sp. TmT3-12]TFC97926.1 organic hydroperoxide resistance protein [Cryobacterium breve]